MKPIEILSNINHFVKNNIKSLAKELYTVENSKTITPASGTLRVLCTMCQELSSNPMILASHLIKDEVLKNYINELDAS